MTSGDGASNWNCTATARCPITSASTAPSPRAQPAPIPGEPHTLGLWVKGNSSWGKVVFEFQDAAGNVWRTHGNEWHDWPGELSINFDGWHFIQFPIDAQSPIIYSSPGGRCQRVKGDGRSVTYPIASPSCTWS